MSDKSSQVQSNISLQDIMYVDLYGSPSMCEGNSVKILEYTDERGASLTEKQDIIPPNPAFIGKDDL